MCVLTALIFTKEQRPIQCLNGVLTEPEHVTRGWELSWYGLNRKTSRAL